MQQSWLSQLEKLIDRNLDFAKGKGNSDFRLFLTSLPIDNFPISILQSSIKITNEPPVGIKQNLNRLVKNLTEEIIQDATLPYEWPYLLTSLCFLHSIILERRTYNTLG